MPKCELCEREVSRLTGHHLTPKKIARRLKRRGRDVQKQKATLCMDCHRMVHVLFPLDELAGSLNIIADLKKNYTVIKYVRWIKDKPEGAVKHPKRSWSGGKYE